MGSWRPEARATRRLLQEPSRSNRTPRDAALEVGFKQPHETRASLSTGAGPLFIARLGASAIRHKPGKACSLGRVGGTRAGLVGKSYPVRIERRF
jgi:hypothetical protein